MLITSVLPFTAVSVRQATCRSRSPRVGWSSLTLNHCCFAPGKARAMPQRGGHVPKTTIIHVIATQVTVLLLYSSLISYKKTFFIPFFFLLSIHMSSSNTPIDLSQETPKSSSKHAPERTPGTTMLPLARIKRVIKEDKDVSLINAEATFCIAYATVSL